MKVFQNSIMILLLTVVSSSNSNWIEYSQYEQEPGEFGFSSEKVVSLQNDFLGNTILDPFLDLDILELDEKTGTLLLQGAYYDPSINGSSRVRNHRAILRPPELFDISSTFSKNSDWNFYFDFAWGAPDAGRRRERKSSNPSWSYMNINQAQGGGFNLDSWYRDSKTYDAGVFALNENGELQGFIDGSDSGDEVFNHYYGTIDNPVVGSRSRDGSSNPSFVPQDMTWDEELNSFILLYHDQLVIWNPNENVFDSQEFAENNNYTPANIYNRALDLLPEHKIGWRMAAQGLDVINYRDDPRTFRISEEVWDSGAILDLQVGNGLIALAVEADMSESISQIEARENLQNKWNTEADKEAQLFIFDFQGSLYQRIDRVLDFDSSPNSILVQTADTSILYQVDTTGVSDSRLHMNSISFYDFVGYSPIQNPNAGNQITRVRLSDDGVFAALTSQNTHRIYNLIQQTEVEIISGFIGDSIFAFFQPERNQLRGDSDQGYIPVWSSISPSETVDIYFKNQGETHRIQSGRPTRLERGNAEVRPGNRPGDYYISPGDILLLPLIDPYENRRAWEYTGLAFWDLENPKTVKTLTFPDDFALVDAIHIGGDLVGIMSQRNGLIYNAKTEQILLDFELRPYYGVDKMNVNQVLDHKDLVWINTPDLQRVLVDTTRGRVITYIDHEMESAVDPSGTMWIRGEMEISRDTFNAEFNLFYLDFSDNQEQTIKIQRYHEPLQFTYSFDLEEMGINQLDFTRFERLHFEQGMHARVVINRDGSMQFRPLYLDLIGQKVDDFYWFYDGDAAGSREYKAFLWSEDYVKQRQLEYSEQFPELLVGYDQYLELAKNGSRFSIRQSETENQEASIPDEMVVLQSYEIDTNHLYYWILRIDDEEAPAFLIQRSPENEFSVFQAIPNP